MLFWSRIEVYSGYSMKDFNELRDILAANNLKYDYRLVNRNSSGVLSSNRSRFAVLGLNHSLETQYYLYVHKKDYDNAMFLMHTAKKQ